MNMVSLRARALLLYFLMGGCVVCVGYEASKGPRQSLPWGVGDILEARVDSGGLTGDFVHYLRAKASKEQFEVFVRGQRLVLMKINADYQGRSYNWRGLMTPNPPWWDPSPDCSTMFVPAKFNSSLIEAAKYENGYVYYMESVGY